MYFIFQTEIYKRPINDITTVQRVVHELDQDATLQSESVLEQVL